MARFDKFTLKSQEAVQAAQETAGKLHHQQMETEHLLLALVDQTDGVKILWPDGWVHVRASNTQSLVRVIAEAASEARAQELADWARERLRI